jgi:two-component system chemotaxis response regulator CheB
MTIAAEVARTGGPVSHPDAAKIMIVDDSAVVRGLVTRMIAEEPSVQVVASCGNGLIAVQKLAHLDIDIILLDIEMPVMDGLTALPKLLAVNPDIKIIISSTLSERNAQISLTALELGAADYVTKPASSVGANAEFKTELLQKLKLFGARRRSERQRTPKPSVDKMTSKEPVKPQIERAPRPVVLRQPGQHKPQILAVGSSTGGPQALFSFFKALPRTIGVPVVVTQHMPATFTKILAEHINRASGWSCREASSGDVLKPNEIYVAPGNQHMLIEARRDERVIRLTQDPPENFCRPAVDPMLRSLVRIYGPKILTVILTGMGSDGLKGARDVVAAGGTLIAQDEATSVVWGMPGAVAGDGLCAAVAPVPELASLAAKAFMGSQR